MAWPISIKDTFTDRLVLELEWCLIESDSVTGWHGYWKFHSCKFVNGSTREECENTFLTTAWQERMTTGTEHKHIKFETGQAHKIWNRPEFTTNTISEDEIGYKMFVDNLSKHNQFCPAPTPTHTACPPPSHKRHIAQFCMLLCIMYYWSSTLPNLQ